jgi:hypothetical protein
MYVDPNDSPISFILPVISTSLSLYNWFPLISLSSKTLASSSALTAIAFFVVDASYTVDVDISIVVLDTLADSNFESLSVIWKNEMHTVTIIIISTIIPETIANQNHHFLTRGFLSLYIKLLL